ncbi:MAG: 4-hydroxythreonine-4-phosphate dehydrogenase PdxA [Planctomycetota bacterium]
MLPRIAITMGDPAGVGPEVCLKAVSDPRILESCTPLLFGDLSVFQAVAVKLSLDLPTSQFAYSDEAWQNAAQPTIVDFDSVTLDEFHPGEVNAKTGQASYGYITAAIDAALAGKVAAITTAPISKDALAQANIDFPGHTEILADRTGTDGYCMMLTSPEISCCLVTTHIGLSEVPSSLTRQRIEQVILMAAEAARRQHGRNPRITVCGLNPHAGENGLFGNGEEEHVIQPAIDSARKHGLDISGPIPADTAFLAPRRKATDVYVCMYHDQGLIPLKTLSFDIAVNVTLGLPIIRTSVDHGTACDLAWQGRASSSSLVEAILYAVRNSK